MYAYADQRDRQTISHGQYLGPAKFVCRNFSPARALGSVWRPAGEDARNSTLFASAGFIHACMPSPNESEHSVLIAFMAKCALMARGR
ncbi:hypothetical protein HaLaN_07799 [Haematococcus lacustris]|uniref:Uncharacterized protein n=1 Tax=Haematococcus lacustris TaxID=44745 RepID=A0A699YPW2_HAELA|nr:hypothetical protein HaLaN_07799 [Haematococcus lacustris]